MLLDTLPATAIATLPWRPVGLLTLCFTRLLTVAAVVVSSAPTPGEAVDNGRVQDASTCSANSGLSSGRYLGQPGHALRTVRLKL
jgi:hypothetical protein